jgi:multimeric flavodoxin WrbA
VQREGEMKVVAFNGSPRKNGNTAKAVGVVFEALNKQGIETELVQVGKSGIKPCRACFRCKEKKDGFCYGEENDLLNEFLKKIYGSDGIIIGSPVYFGSLTPETKALIDRVGYCSRNGGFLLKRKVGAGIAIARRQCAGSVVDQIHNLFAVNQCIIPCSTYWNIALSGLSGDIDNDEEGINTFRILGENMAWLIKKISI